MKAILCSIHNNRITQRIAGNHNISTTQKYCNYEENEKLIKAKQLLQDLMDNMAKEALGEDTLECCFCGKPVIAYKSHSPAPAESDPTCRCCEDCNYSIVQPFRYKVFTTPEEQLDENCKQWLNNRISF